MGRRGHGNNGGGRGGYGHGSGNGNGNGNGNSQGGAGAKTCHLCHKIGHIAADCRSAGQQEKRYCTNCRMTNHNTADCTRGGKKSQREIKFDPNGNKNNSPGNRKVTRPCKFCGDMHLDKECPTRHGGMGFNGAGPVVTHQGDSLFRDVFGTPEYSPPCHHCNGHHLSTNCPKIAQQSVEQYQYQRYPAQPIVIMQPTKSLWEICDEIEEEFVAGDPWYDATRAGPVDPNRFPTHYTQDVCAVVCHQQNILVDRDGDRYMDAMDGEWEDANRPRW